MTKRTSFILPRIRLNGFVKIFFAIGFFVLSPFFFSNRLSVQAAVVINEVFPKTEDATREWVELYNNGGESVSLDRWRLQNAAGTPFIINASGIIQPNGFLTFEGSQTGISFNIQGDRIDLFDANNTKIDSESYPGTLGYNRSMGRSIDGAGVWTICTMWTQNSANNCPPPPPTPTPTATSAPTPSVTPLPSPSTTPTTGPTAYPTETTIVITDELSSNTLGAPTNIQHPTATPGPNTLMTRFAQEQDRKYFKTMILAVFSGLALWGIMVATHMWYTHHHKKV